MRDVAYAKVVYTVSGLTSIEYKMDNCDAEANDFSHGRGQG